MTKTKSSSSRGLNPAWQMLTLVVLAATLALAVNALRPDGLVLVGDWSEKGRLAADDGRSLWIAPDQARQLFEAGRAMFADARAPALYEQGHIRGAINLPWPDFDRWADQVVAKYDVDTVIISYCDGQACALSKDLAMFLYDLGYQKVRVLVNGWSVWQDLGLPTDTGSADPFHQSVGEPAPLK